MAIEVDHQHWPSNKGLMILLFEDPRCSLKKHFKTWINLEFLIYPKRLDQQLFPASNSFPRWTPFNVAKVLAPSCPKSPRARIAAAATSSLWSLAMFAWVEPQLIFCSKTLRSKLSQFLRNQDESTLVIFHHLSQGWLQIQRLRPKNTS